MKSNDRNNRLAFEMLLNMLAEELSRRIATQVADEVADRVASRVAEVLAKTPPPAAPPPPRPLSSSAPEPDQVYLEFKHLKHFGVFYTNKWLKELEKQGKFPKRVMLGERHSCWRRSEIEEHQRKKFGGPSTPVEAPRKRRQRHLQRK